MRRPRCSATGSPADVGAGLDPCGALHVVLELEPGESRRVAFVLGQGARSRSHAIELVVAILVARRRRTAALAAAERMWDDMLGAVQVHTPDDSFDLIVNRWLLYQTLACRIWARSGPYRPGGAFVGSAIGSRMFFALLSKSVPLSGTRQFVRRFRDSLLKAMCSTGGIRRAARGTRTRCSDDLLWLPYALCGSVGGTTTTTPCSTRGDPLLDGPAARTPIGPNLHSANTRTGARAPPCGARAARDRPVAEIRLTRSPAHRNGRLERRDEPGQAVGVGESVWLGWFLVTVLERFATLCEEAQRRGRAVAGVTPREARRLTGMLELAGDGKWYRRACFDDGTLLGSVKNEECEVDWT